jgi:hypothetical protein
VRLRRIAELEEARKALSAQDAYVWAQQAQADIPVVTHDDLRRDFVTLLGGAAAAWPLCLQMENDSQSVRWRSRYFCPLVIPSALLPT